MTIELKHISKSYDGLPVLRDLNLTFCQGGCYCLMSPSGSGKTTLLRILMGLEQADEGTILAKRGTSLAAPGTSSAKRSITLAAPGTSLAAPGTSRPSFTVSPVFQEDRLCESFSPMDNVAMCAGRALKPSRIKWELARLLPEECLTRPVSTLSGGMKRRVAVMRALLTPSDILIMDEPFTGMDEELKRSVIAYIKEKQEGRLLILSTHQEEDAALMGGEVVRFHSLESEQ